MAILIDFSGIAIAGTMAIQSQLIGKTEKEYIDSVRHVILTSILGHKKKYSKEFGQVIIACDGPSYWRRQYFPHYKASRRKSREESNMDWDLVFKAVNSVRDELAEHFPYKLIYIERAEADDVIACLTKHFREEFGEMEKVMIISFDNDMSQLQHYNGVSQYSPMTKKMITLSKKEVKEYVNVSTVKGQGKDGIPSIKQADDALVVEDKKRAPPISQKRLDEFLEKGIEACADEFERKNYERNQILFDFNFIPEDVHESIILEYKKPRKKKFDRYELMNFFIKNKCNQLLKSLEEF